MIKLQERKCVHEGMSGALQSFALWYAVASGCVAGDVRDDRVYRCVGPAHRKNEGAPTP